VSTSSLFTCDFGDLVLKEDDKDQVLGPAILWRADTNFLLTKIDVDLLSRNKKRLSWVPRTNIMNYARRMFAAGGATTDAKPQLAKSPRLAISTSCLASVLVQSSIST
jgi:hypothetical protein